MDKITFDFNGKTAVITGGAQGFGLDIAKRFLKSGAQVIIWDVDSKMLEKAIKDLDNPNLSSNIVDVSNYKEVEKCTNKIIENTNIDILINNAGISDPVPALEEDLEQFRRVIQIDLISCFHLAKLCAKHMKDQEQVGAIVNVASVHGFVGSSPNNQPGYTAAKGGLVNLTRELALEWARYGIRVNAIAPGYISTELTDEMIAGESGRKWIERNTPLRRPGDVSELDGAMLLLSSDAGSYITGETIAVDGGWLAR